LPGKRYELAVANLFHKPNPKWNKRICELSTGRLWSAGLALLLAPSRATPVAFTAKTSWNALTMMKAMLGPPEAKMS
jgi:hypothetical protein